MSRVHLIAAAACCMLAAAACDSEDPKGPGPTPHTPVGSVEIGPVGPALAVGQTIQLNAVVKDESGKPLSGRTVTWSTSAAAVAEVDASGRVTGKSEGTATIAAAVEGKTAQAAILVQPAPVAAVTVTPATAQLGIGEKVQLVAVPRDAQGTPLAGRAVEWTTSDPAIVTVDAATGEVTGVDDGTATVTASSEGRSGTAELKVVVPVASVTVTMALDTLEAYETRTLAATLRDAHGRVLTGREVMWTSSDAAVATIDPATGVLTGVDRGTVTVTASSEGKTGTASRVVVIRYRSITAGAMHACDLASGGIAWCWGLNGRQGRIGLERLADDEHSTVPVRVPGGHRFAQLATYGTTTCGITLEGKAYCWGAGGWGVLGNGASADSRVPVPVSGGHTFRQLAAGSHLICGVTTDNRVLCWGYNSMGELGNGQRASSQVPVQAAPGLTFASVTAGGEYTCGVALGGAGYCWGYSGLGNLGDGAKISFGNTSSLTPVTVVGGHTFAQLAAGQRHTCGLTTAGQVYCWGGNSGKLGNGQGLETSTPSAIAGGRSYRSVSTGFAHSCAITTAGELYCWGGNGNGQLGLVLQNGSNVPVRAAGALRFAEVSAANVATGSGSYTCGIADDRLTTYCWGRNDVGQLGNGTRTSAAAVNATPSIVEGQKPL